MTAKRLDEPKDPGETVPLTFDFTTDLGGAAIAGVPTCTVTVDNTLSRGTDASPSALLTGTTVVVDNVVTQWITGGLHGVDYKVRCSIATNTTPPGPLFKSSILMVRTQ